MPGYAYITEYMQNSQRIIEQRITNWKTQPLFGTFLSSVTLLVISYLGARETIGKVQSIDPGSKEYDEFVKNTLLSLFQPFFEQLRQSEQ